MSNLVLGKQIPVVSNGGGAACRHQSKEVLPELGVGPNCLADTEMYAGLLMLINET